MRASGLLLIVVTLLCVSHVFAPAPLHEDLRWRVVFMYWEGRGLTETAKLLQISRPSAVRWLGRYFCTGDVSHTPWRRVRLLRLPFQVQMIISFCSHFALPLFPHGSLIAHIAHTAHTDVTALTALTALTTPTVLSQCTLSLSAGLETANTLLEYCHGWI